MLSDEESVIDLGRRTTSAYLGYVDVEISQEEQPAGDDSFIGGEPLWVGGIPAPKDYVECGNCNELMALLLQCYVPLPDSANERVLYIFGCKNYKCSRKKGSIKCVKGLVFKKKEKTLEEKLAEEKEKQFDLTLKQGLFGKGKTDTKENPFASSSGNPFGGNPFAGGSNPFDVKPNSQSSQEAKPLYSQIASKNAAIQKPEKKTQITKNKNVSKYTLPQYPGYILYLEREKLGTDDDVLPPIPSDLQIEELDDAESIKEAIKKEKASKDKVSEFKSEILKDSDFQNFSKQVAHNPRQVVRYDLGGQPLVYSSKDQKLLQKIPAPTFNPHSERQFELQLMPKAIMDLEIDISNPAEGMEWGSILVYTDVEDFIPKTDILGTDSEGHDVGYVEEYVIVEWEDQMDYTKIK